MPLRSANLELTSICNAKPAWVDNKGQNVFYKSMNGVLDTPTIFYTFVIRKKN